MERGRALALLREHIKNENLIKHMIASEAVMRVLARKFGEDQDKWGLAGLLHDIDWEETQDTPERHTEVSRKYLTEAGLDAEIVKAIYVHNDMHGVKPETLFEKALICSEELTGLITACALVRPEKKLENVKVKSILKKFKNPSFAAGVHRATILKCQDLIGMSLEELAELELKAMRAISDELGL